MLAFPSPKRRSLASTRHPGVLRVIAGRLDGVGAVVRER